MRIKFSTDVAVNIADIPSSAFGALAIRHAVYLPEFSTEDGLNADGKMVEVAPAGHYFRKDWSAFMPDKLAQKYIDAGQAQPCDRDIRLVDSLEDMPE